LLIFLEIQNLTDWYKISVHQFIELGGAALLHYHHGSLINILKTVYPEFNWKNFRFSNPHQIIEKGKSAFGKMQFLLYQYVKQIFPGLKIEFNFLLKFLGQTRTELDIFVPDLSLAFEYNGEYHYKSVVVFNDVSTVQKRDKFKRDFCFQCGITLITIPFWWDKKNCKVSFPQFNYFVLILNCQM